MKSPAALIIDLKKIEAEILLLKVRVNVKGKIEAKDMQAFEKLLGKGEPIIAELEKQGESEMFLPGGKSAAVAGFKALRQQTDTFYKQAKLCKDGIYRTPRDIQKLGKQKREELGLE